MPREIEIPPEKHPLASFLRELHLRSPLGLAEHNAVLNLPYRLRRLDAGSHLVREGEPPASCALLVEGFAFRHKTTSGGGRQIMALCIPGDAVDLLNIFLDVSDHAVQMLTSGTVADLSRPHLQGLALTHPTVGGALIRATLIDASILREWVVNVGRRNARERIAHILCEFAVRLEDRGLARRGSFELPMTQEQLADATGLTPAHVNRILKVLEREGLIKRQRRHIEFTNWRALQSVGDFTRQYLHLSSEDVLAAA